MYTCLLLVGQGLLDRVDDPRVHIGVRGDYALVLGQRPPLRKVERLTVAVGHDAAGLGDQDRARRLLASARSRPSDGRDPRSSPGTRR